ncbi:flagellar hook-length control protein FliK [Agromyces soli]
MVSLARRGRGEHLVSVRVAPEEFGPVTVRAVVGADGQVRVELQAPSEAGREALRQALGDLRRDGAAAGFGATLDLAPRDDDDRPADADESPGATETGRGRPAGATRAAAAALHPSTWPRPDGTGLDVIA